MKKWLPAVGWLSIALLSHHTTPAQCPYGITPGSNFYDTVIATPAGINTMFIKFPKARPANGMLTCMRLCISITGVVDSVSVENNSASPQVANVYYIRTDQVIGPGLSGPLSSSVTHTYGPYNLGGTNGVLGSGPDFVAISHDTVLNSAQVCQTVTNPDSLYQFYGQDSLTYQYTITAFTNVTCTGGNYNSTVATSALVRFRMTYCTCPGLFLGIQNSGFEAIKTGPNRARLNWNVEEPDPQSCYYVPEISRDGRDFTGIGRVAAARSGERLGMDYDAGMPGGACYFRLRQVYQNGQTLYSQVRLIRFDRNEPLFFLYPNPSRGPIGIKFAYAMSGRCSVEVLGPAGQQLRKLEIPVFGHEFPSMINLPKGIYWIKVTDHRNERTEIRELIIQ